MATPLSSSVTTTWTCGGVSYLTRLDATLAACNAAINAPNTVITVHGPGFSVTYSGTSPANPIASFSVTNTNLVATIVDTTSDSGGTITSESWDFGDGNTSTVIGNQTHTYSAAGTYTITLTVTDSSSATNSTTHVITVTSSGGGGGTGFLYKYVLEAITPNYNVTVPPVGSSWTCQESGAVVTRITDFTTLPGKPSDCTGVVIDYSRFTPESPSGAYLYVNGVGGNDNAWLLNTSDWSVKRKLTGADGSSLGENNLIRWDASQPSDTFYYVLGMKLYRQAASDGTNTLVRDFSSDFPTCQQITNGVEGDCSLDGTKWAFMAQIYTGGYWTSPYIFCYEASTDSILGTYTNSITSPENSSPNMVDMVPDGSGVLIDWGVSQGTATDQNGAHVYPTSMSAASAVRVGHGEEHSGWAMNSSGVWGFVSQDNSTDNIIWCSLTNGYNGSDMVVINNMSNFGFAEGGDWHFGKLNVRGFVPLYAAHTADAQPGDNQVLYFPISANAVPLLVTATYNDETGQYYDQCFGAGSLDGQRAYWGADYGKKLTGEDVFMTVIPSDWSTHAPG